MPSRSISLSASALALAALVFAGACGTDAIGVDACQKIEKTRCENAPSCGLSLADPVHRGSSAEDDVRACIRYYDDACLHGLAAASEPGSVAVQACVDAINAGDCTVVKSPEVHPACSFLGTSADAGSDAS